MKGVKVRILGDVRLSSKILEVIRRNFVCSDIRHLNRLPYRYGMGPGITIYITVEEERGG